MYTDSLNIFVLDLNIICKIINCFLKTLKALKPCSITVTELLFHEKGPFDIVIIFFEAIVSMIDIWQILLSTITKTSRLTPRHVWNSNYLTFFSEL